MKVRLSYEFEITEAKIKQIYGDNEATKDAIDILFRDGRWKGAGHWPYDEILGERKHALDIMAQTLVEDIINGMGEMKYGEYTETIEEIKLCQQN
jgi:hypothetical protein